MLQKAYLRMSIHDGCNLRCTYCRPPIDLRLSRRRPELSQEQLLQIAKQMHATIGLAKIRLTGGEPLLRPDVVKLVEQLKCQLDQIELCMTTNGVLLQSVAAALRQAGLDRINISLDTVEANWYYQLTRGGRLEQVYRGIEAARDAGFDKLKLNSVLLRSYASRLPQLVRYAAGVASELRFIELMPISVAAGMHRTEFFSAAEAMAVLERTFSTPMPLTRVGVSKRYAFSVDGRDMVIGFIPSVTEPFCNGCNRLRLDSRGRLFACLRHPDWLELAGPLARGELDEVSRRIARVCEVKRIPDSIWPGRQMSAIGG